MPGRYDYTPRSSLQRGRLGSPAHGTQPVTSNPNLVDTPGFQVPDQMVTGGINPWAGFNTKGSLNFGNVLRGLGFMYPQIQQQRQQYVGAANQAFEQNNSFLNGPLFQSLQGGIDRSLQPVISPDQLSAMQGAGRDRVATEGAALQNALRAQLAAQGQTSNGMNPAFIGAAYNTAYQSGQSDINQAMQAAQINQQGLLGGLQAGQGLYGAAGALQGQNLQQFMDYLGTVMGFSQEDRDLLVALLGAKIA